MAKYRKKPVEVEAVLEMEPIITLIASEIKMQQEEQIWRAVQEVDIHVDKERLLKALEDAKSFWEEGYRAGKNRPHGRWEKSEDEYFSLALFKCSLCREEWCFEIYEDMELLNYRYCPNCGAKMDLEEDDA